MKKLILFAYFVGVKSTLGGFSPWAYVGFQTKTEACAYIKANSASVADQFYTTKSATTSAVTWKAYTCP